jgi:predicted Fe-Mo cluster-binding NifX family protein
MKIAVSSLDGKTICGQLGSCNQFIIFEADEFGIKNRKLRDSAFLSDAAMADGRHRDTMLQDCQAVITQGMSRGMYEGLYRAGIIPVITMENEPAAAVRQFVSGCMPSAHKGDCSCGDH